MGVMLCCGMWRRRQIDDDEIPSRVQPSPVNIRSEAETRKRETLHKKTPTQPIFSIATDSSILKQEIVDSKESQIDVAAVVGRSELDVESPRSTHEAEESQQTDEEPLMAAAEAVRDPPAECVELPADPAPRRKPVIESMKRPPLDELHSVSDQGPQTKHFKPYRGMSNPLSVPFGTIESQTMPSLQPHPPCLMPGSCRSAPEMRRATSLPQDATWNGESLKGVAFGLVPRRLGFGSGWWTGIDFQDFKVPSLQAVSPTDATTARGSDTPPTLSPLSPLSPLSSTSPLSSESNLSSKDVSDVDQQLHERRTAMFQNPADSTTSISRELGISSRQSNSNINQLLTRHVLLESRRQILLRLQEIEEEQEQILEKLAALPEG